MLVAPSVLTADFTKLKEELDSIKDSDLIHIDIMDGHFVPNISFGPAITKDISKATNIPLDIHLMVSNPLQWIDDFAQSNPVGITIHFEANDVLETIEKIKSLGIKVGLSIKPKTTIQEIVHLLPQVDLVLIMSVEPGFGGQTFMNDSLVKIRTLAQLKKHHNFLIEVDGGINAETAALVKEAGCDIVVAGSYLFNMSNRGQGIKTLK